MSCILPPGDEMFLPQSVVSHKPCQKGHPRLIRLSFYTEINSVRSTPLLPPQRWNNFDPRYASVTFAVQEALRTPKVDRIASSLYCGSGVNFIEQMDCDRCVRDFLLPAPLSHHRV